MGSLLVFRSSVSKTFKEFDSAIKMLNIYHYRLEKGVYKKLEITNQVQNIFSFSIRVITSLTAQSGGSTQVSLKSSEALLDQRPLAFLRDYPWPFLGDCPWPSLGQENNGPWILPSVWGNLMEIYQTHNPRVAHPVRTYFPR